VNVLTITFGGTVLSLSSSIAQPGPGGGRPMASFAPADLPVTSRSKLAPICGVPGATPPVQQDRLGPRTRRISLLATGLPGRDAAPAETEGV